MLNSVYVIQIMNYYLMIIIIFKENIVVLI